MKTLLFAIAQLNPTVGDIAGNTKKLAEAFRSAQAQGADIVIAPETYLSGYQVDDLVQVEGFLDEMDKAVHHLATPHFREMHQPLSWVRQGVTIKALSAMLSLSLTMARSTPSVTKHVFPALAFLTTLAISSRVIFPALSYAAVSAWVCLFVKICGMLTL